MTDTASGGSLVPDEAWDELLRQFTTANPYAALLPTLPPLTRRQRIRGRLNDWRWTVSAAWDVLRGRHDCGTF